MKFICQSCKKTFVYPAKLQEAIEKVGILESHVCPYCRSLDFTEYIEEPKTEPKMLDMIECEVTGVKDALEKGYVVLDRYAKAIRMTLYEKPAEEAKT